MRRRMAIDSKVRPYSIPLTEEPVSKSMRKVCSLMVMGPDQTGGMGREGREGGRVEACRRWRGGVREVEADGIGIVVQRNIDEARSSV